MPSQFRTSSARRLLPTLCLLSLLVSVAGSSRAAAGTAEPLPPTLAETGLYADAETATPAPGVVEYQPQFPLWTDGLLKRRWIQLPAGTSIDASNPDAWVFPVGTKLWKEFALPERPVETRLLELTPTGWRFATYVWSDDVRTSDEPGDVGRSASTATLAPERGVRGVAELAPGVRHDVPSVFDCATCHEAQSQRVLGFSAVHLAVGRTGPGPDLAELSAQGLLSGVPDELLQPAAAPGRADEALGYLHGNCGHCHNAEGPLAALGLDLRLGARSGANEVPPALATSLLQRATATARSAPATHRIEPGDPASSQIVQRLSTRDPFAQMPPLGTRLVDQHAVDLLVSWIRHDLRADTAAPAATSAPASR